MVVSDTAMTRIFADHSLLDQLPLVKAHTFSFLKMVAFVIAMTRIVVIPTYWIGGHLFEICILFF